jgi:hypothetical protein
VKVLVFPGVTGRDFQMCGFTRLISKLLFGMSSFCMINAGCILGRESGPILVLQGGGNTPLGVMLKGLPKSGVGQILKRCPGLKFPWEKCRQGLSKSGVGQILKRCPGLKFPWEKCRQGLSKIGMYDG